MNGVRLSIYLLLATAAVALGSEDSIGLGSHRASSSCTTTTTA